MKYIIKIIFLIYVIISFIPQSSVGYLEVSVLLVITAVNVLKEKYFDTRYLSILSFALILTGIYLNSNFTILLSVALFDMVFEKFYPGILASVIFIIYLGINQGNVHTYMLVACICAFTAFTLNNLGAKTTEYKAAMDRERRARYDLENAKARLMNSARESARLAEISERNRIAREIHDSVGHRIAGILIQLQASNKLRKTDLQKSNDILEKSIQALSDSLTLLRDTVHRLKPRENIGLGYIREIIDNFKFCPVEFKHFGDFNTIESNHVEILATNIKEALTNASKHSGATKVVINITINDNLIHLLIKDNGKGCSRIHEGLGLSGIRERMTNAGGSVSISGENGFIIVCIIPLGKGVKVFESANSRR